MCTQVTPIDSHDSKIYVRMNTNTPQRIGDSWSRYTSVAVGTY